MEGMMSWSVGGILFVGLSACGKSTLMSGLASRYPTQFYLPTRLTSRKPKIGDVDGECDFVDGEDINEMKLNGELGLVMCQDPNVHPSQQSFSGELKFIFLLLLYLSLSFSHITK
jgi:energy-coupling factor transporter ATP-binding protein EcfA2